MSGSQAKPKRVYKYRSFSATTLTMLVEDTVFFADPSTFNDPLDTNPTVVADITVPEMERVVRWLIERRVGATKRAAAKSLGYNGPRTIEQVTRLSEMEADRLLADLTYRASDPDGSAEPPGPHLKLLAAYVERELLLQYDKGVLSLAKRPTCPLMWSHYGDQHQGLCLGYAVPAHVAPLLQQVRYQGGRLVHASLVAKMLDGDTQATADVDSAVLLRKAADWRYEREWRLFGPRGAAPCPLDLDEVTFGLRCRGPLQHAVAAALKDRDRPVRFYEICEEPGMFKLRRRAVDPDELGKSYQLSAYTLQSVFDDLTVSAQSG